MTMRRINDFWILAGTFAFAFFVSTTAFAEDAPISNAEFFQAVWEFIGGVKGASAMAIAVGVVQLLMKFFKTSLANFAGVYKLLAVSGLTIVFEVLSSMATGVPFLSALISGGALAAFQVFAYQLYKQLTEKPASV